VDAIDVLVDAFGRARSDATRAVDGLTAANLVWRPDDEANPIAWLVWHLTRVQDDHVADLAGTEQVYTADGWARRFDLPLDDMESSALGLISACAEKSQGRRGRC